MTTRTDKTLKKSAPVITDKTKRGRSGLKQRVRIGRSKTSDFRLDAFKYYVDTPLNVQMTIDVIRDKLPTKLVGDAIEFLALPKAVVLEGLRIPMSSYHRKLSGNQLLSSDETERVMRLAEVTRSATEAFGGGVPASAWMGAPNKALAGKTPLSLIDTDAGTSQVRRVLSVINYGGVL